MILCDCLDWKPSEQNGWDLEMLQEIKQLLSTNSTSPCETGAASPRHGWRALPSFLHSNMQCLAWLLRLNARFRIWPSSAVIKWCAKNGEMSLKTFQSSDSIAHTSSCCQTCFQNENWSPAQQGNVRPPTSTRKKKGKCLVHNPSYSAYAEPQPEAVTQGMNFLETVRNGKHLAWLPCFNLVSFPLRLAENRQVGSSILGLDTGSKSSLDTNYFCPQPLKSMGLHTLVQKFQLESDDVRSELLSAIHACLRVLKK